MPPALGRYYSHPRTHPERFETVYVHFYPRQANNHLGDEGALVVSKALSNGLMPNLAMLDLDQNNITDKGGRHIADMLSSNDSLKSLHLSDNSLGDLGLVAIADSLGVRENAGVSEMRFLFFQVTTGVYEQHNTRLQTLSLENNGIGARGLEALWAVAKTHNRLVQLKSSQSPLSHTLLPEVVETNAKLQAAVKLNRNAKLRDLKLAFLTVS